MDDVDAVQAQIARNMLESGDWVTARLNGVAYLEKAPLIYWVMALSFKIFGVSDWAARLPLALSNIALCWVTARFGQWAFGRTTGTLAGLVPATCVGMFLFTRILIPDATLALALTSALFAFLRLTEADEPRPWVWTCILYGSLACGILLKGLIALVFPVGAAVLYLTCLGRGMSIRIARIHLVPGITGLLLIAAPWHVLATLRNPPHFAWTFVSRAGQYHGFFWFYFFNEHILRFLNLRYPRDYNTVPRIWFWLLHAVWLFPWSASLPGVFRLRYGSESRESRIRLFLAIWILFILLFFTFSTTQEYYSLPIYPAAAILIANSMARQRGYSAFTRGCLAALFSCALLTCTTLLVKTAAMPASGDISAALTQNPSLYTLSLGHMGDLTLHAFAYLRTPLMIVAVSMLIAVPGMLAVRSLAPGTAVLCLSMLVFLQGARLALVTFDPYLGSKPLADALIHAPPGVLVEGDAYYAFSSVFFYTNRQALLWRGQVDNLEYGSNAPDAPRVFIGDARLKDLWSSEPRVYLLASRTDLPLLNNILGAHRTVLAKCGEHYLLVNQQSR
ncbi:MAG: glycosyl transferase, family 39 [Acidobacteriaceae bacterium]|nr:glycosyl transferase, family 39 [Acidobacteriaceae bacterium]